MEEPQRAADQEGHAHQRGRHTGATSASSCSSSSSLIIIIIIIIIIYSIIIIVIVQYYYYYYYYLNSRQGVAVSAWVEERHRVSWRGR